VIEEPLQLVAFEYRRELPGGRTGPLLVAAMLEDGSELEVVVKLRHPDARDGHFEGTSLACELVCSVLGRAVGLSVPDYSIVEIPAELPEGVADRRIRDLLTRNVGDNFATRYQEGYGLWNPAYRPRSSDLMEALEDVLSFDATVINGDRKAAKPNLLWRGENLLAIDHSLALPVHQWDDEVIASSPLMPEAEVRAHCAFDALAGRLRQFQAMLDRWRTRVPPEDLARLRTFIPASWERRPGDLDRVFRFLTERPPRFDAIAGELRRVT